MNVDAFHRFFRGQQMDEPWHTRRYVESLRRIAPWMPECRVLELGGRSVFTAALESFFPTATVVAGDAFDARHSFPFDDQQFDLVLCMEVLEHVQDRDPRNTRELASFTGSGVRNLLLESHRVLMPGGRLFLTTPNVCGYYNLLRLLEHRHPFMLAEHHREFSVEDVRELILEAGFELVELSAETVWHHHGMPSHQVAALARLVRELRFRDDLRGDCLFAVARRREVAGEAARG